MNDLKQRINKATQLIQDAEYVVVGAGAGLSEAAGFHYVGERYHLLFKDFKDKYGINDMYTGTFYDFETEEEKWAFWSRVILSNYYDTKATPVYQNIFNLIKDKPYFVITTNVDGQFEKNGFDMKLYFETQGSYSLLQCKKGCHSKVYDNKKLIQRMVNETKDCKIATSLIPSCPVCGGKMDVHVRKDSYFIETEAWNKHSQSYTLFLKKALKHKVVFLEFGVGFNTPGIIRYPFEQMIYQHKNAYLIRFNRDFADSMKENSDKTISFSENILMVLNLIIKGCENIETAG